MILDGRTVLVTGAARGIGRELTRQLLDGGSHVVAVGRDRERLDALARDHGGRVSPWTVDLADRDAVDTFITEVTGRHPQLSVVVNNAAMQQLTDFCTDDTQMLRPVLRAEIAVNLDAAVTLSTGLLTHLRRQPSAAIVNLTTGLALAPKRSAPVYCATKAGLRTFTRALRYQCQQAAPHVRVVDAVLPLVDTDMTRGRGSGKIDAAAAAAAVIAALRRDSAEIYVGRTKILRVLMRISPTLAHRVLRDG